MQHHKMQYYSSISGIELLKCELVINYFVALECFFVGFVEGDDDDDDCSNFLLLKPMRAGPETGVVVFVATAVVLFQLVFRAFAKVY